MLVGRELVALSKSSDGDLLWVARGCVAQTGAVAMRQREQPSISRTSTLSANTDRANTIKTDRTDRYDVPMDRWVCEVIATGWW